MNELNLPEHWKIARLGEVTEIVKGGTPSRSVERYFQGDIAWAIPSDITALDSALYIEDTASQISEEGLSKSAAKLLPPGTVLLTSRATIGETAIATVPMATNQGFSNFICNDEILNVYLAYYLRHIKTKLNVLARGSTFKEVTKGTLLNVEIPLPPFPEQHAIAHTLQTIQEAKFTRQREIALERERKAALMDHLFSHGTKGEPHKQTEIGKIPESWEIVKLGDKAELKNGINFKKEQKGQGILTVDVLNMYSDGIYLSTDNLYRVDRKIKGRDLLKTNDILFVRSSLKQEGVAWTSLFGEHTEPVTFCGFLIRARLTTPEIDPEFLTNYFRATFARKFLVSKSSRLAITNVSQAILNNCPIVLPSLNEQRKIAEILHAFDTKIASLEREVKLIDELFHAMLEELMTGQRSTAPLN